MLYRDVDTGGADVALDPAHPDTVYAVLWQARRAPWENGAFRGPGSGMFKSTDGGTTWQPIMNGLPTFANDELGRIVMTLAPSQPQRLFAMVDATRGGLYRSDDAGATWRLANADGRTVPGSQVADLAVDPRNPDVVYLAGAGAWKSVDGGRTFAAWAAGAAGDDYHRLWINPDHPDTMLLAGGQGAGVTLNGGRTWSSSLNQPTGQFTQVATDAAFPYRVCGAPPQRNAACVASRSGSGRITIRDWDAVGSDDAGSIAPDPLDSEILYYGGRLARYDRRTGQSQDVLPPLDRDFRVLRTAPLLFSPADPHTLFFAGSALWKTVNGGQTWAAISPDLARPTWEVPPSIGVYRDSEAAAPARRGVISTVAPSAIDQNLVWTGTDDGLIHLTRDAGRTWTDVTPSALVPWARVSGLAASHFDVNTAYAAVDASRLDDLHPYLYRTRDGGRSWTLAAAGLPDVPVNTVREDPQRRGLLFAGSERAVHVSFDDGDHWQSLRLNMPATPIRDLTIKDEDLVVATYGRGFWILDDITPLRQITADVARADVFLFRPPTAWRFRSDEDTGAAWPSGEPSSPNPPAGVTITYLLGPNVQGPVTLEIVETTTGTLIRRYSSDAADPHGAPPDAADSPSRPPVRLSTQPGLHRWVWDVRFTPPPFDQSRSRTGPLAGGTPTARPGIWVLPGTYQVRLSVGDRVYRQAVLVKMDPRVKTAVADLTAQFRLSKALDDAMRELHEARRALTGRQSGASGQDAIRLQAVATELDEAYAPIPALFATVQQADAKPTAAVEAAVTAALRHASDALTRYKDAGTG